MLKYLLMFLTPTLYFANETTAQEKKHGIEYENPIRLDSSDFSMIPLLVERDQNNSGKGKSYTPYGSYSDIYFYNAKNNQSKKLFNNRIVLITPFSSPRYYDDKTQTKPANILAKHIIYFVRSENYDGKNNLDTQDPVYLFISLKDGTELKQVTPSGKNVTSFHLYEDKKMILLKVQEDSNNDKRFDSADDYAYYRIDLDDDISKIKCYPINFN